MKLLALLLLFVSSSSLLADESSSCIVFIEEKEQFVIDPEYGDIPRQNIQEETPKSWKKYHDETLEGIKGALRFHRCEFTDKYRKANVVLTDYTIGCNNEHSIHGDWENRWNQCEGYYTKADFYFKDSKTEYGFTGNDVRSYIDEADYDIAIEVLTREISRSDKF